MDNRRTVVFIFLSILLAGCTSELASAPVINGWHQPNAASQTYVVRQGDTLYSIAWAFGLDYRSLVEANHLQAPYSIHVGQSLVMTSNPPSEQGESSHTNGRTSSVVTPHTDQTVAQSGGSTIDLSHWAWPAKGQLVSRFSSSSSGYQGIEIAGKLGQPIYASTAGEVVYSGSGVRGYGNLIIIKHNTNYLTAYAFNQKRLVTVGETVRLGQEIALMGQNNAGKTLLYFEVRKNGKPVNPLSFLG